MDSINLCREPERHHQFDELVKQTRKWSFLTSIALSAISYGSYIAIEAYTLPPTAFVITGVLAAGAVFYLAKVIFASYFTKKAIQQEIVHDKMRELKETGLPNLNYIKTDSGEIHVTIENDSPSRKALTDFIQVLKKLEKIPRFTIEFNGEGFIEADMFFDIIKTLQKKNVENIEIENMIVVNFYGVMCIAGHDSHHFMGWNQNTFLKQFYRPLAQRLVPMVNEKSFRSLKLVGEGKYDHENEVKDLPKPDMSPFKKKTEGASILFFGGTTVEG